MNKPTHQLAQTQPNMNKPTCPNSTHQHEQTNPSTCPNPTHQYDQTQPISSGTKIVSVGQFVDSIPIPFFRLILSLGRLRLTPYTLKTKAKPYVVKQSKIQKPKILGLCVGAC